MKIILLTQHVDKQHDTMTFTANKGNGNRKERFKMKPFDLIDTLSPLKLLFVRATKNNSSNSCSSDTAWWQRRYTFIKLFPFVAFIQITLR